MTQPIGVDSYGMLPARLLAPYDFIMRYVALQPGKCIVASEIPAYHAVGKSVGLVYEDGATDGLHGAPMGAAKAKLALPILKAIGWPADLPVYFAFDMPGYQTALPAFLACALAFAAGIGRPAAVYGDVDTCTYAHEHGVKYLWQFGEGRAPGLTIYQSQSKQLDGYNIDPDTAFAADYGQWAPAPAPSVIMRLVAAITGKKVPAPPIIVTHPGNDGKALVYVAQKVWQGIPDMPEELKLLSVGVKPGNVPSGWWVTAKQEAW